MQDGESGSVHDATEISFIRLAEAHRREGLIDDAIRICREGLGWFPGSLRGRIVLGQCLLDQGAIGEAIVELGRVEREGHGDPEIVALLRDVRLQGPEPVPVGADLVARSESPAADVGGGLSGEPAEPAVLILEPIDYPSESEETPGASEGDPLASATLAQLYASQGDSATAEAIRRQITAAEAEPAPEPSSPPAPRLTGYLSELRRVREIADRLRKTQPA